MIELNDLPVVDVHCHPFIKLDELSPDSFVNLAAFPGAGADFLIQAGVADNIALAEVQMNRRDTLFVRTLVRQLAAFFNCEPTLDQVVIARNRASQQDFRTYVKHLYQACCLKTLVVDFGYPKPLIDMAQFKADVPVEVVPVYRIETFIDPWIHKEISWGEFLNQYEQTLSNALKNGYKGLKSIIAYRTGLDVSPHSRAPDQAGQVWDAVRRGAGQHKPLRDFLLCRSMEMCIEYDVPMQIHTGIGDHEVNLMACRPSLLMDLLRSPAFRACKVLLVHAGYPYHAEAGYMVNVLPRVYCDVSEGVPFTALGTHRIFNELLEMAPFSKVLYGSDGYVLPEIAYIGALLGKKALALALDELVDSGMLDQAEACEAAGLILAGNAERLYGLS